MCQKAHTSRESKLFIVWAALVSRMSYIHTCMHACMHAYAPGSAASIAQTCPYTYILTSAGKVSYLLCGTARVSKRSHIHTCIRSRFRCKHRPNMSLHIHTHKSRQSKLFIVWGCACFQEVTHTYMHAYMHTLQVPL